MKKERDTAKTRVGKLRSKKLLRKTCTGATVAKNGEQPDRRGKRGAQRRHVAGEPLSALESRHENAHGVAFRLLVNREGKKGGSGRRRPSLVEGPGDI